jgi:hypothetical protein
VTLYDEVATLLTVDQFRRLRRRIADAYVSGEIEWAAARLVANHLNHYERWLAAHRRPNGRPTRPA